MDEGTDWNRSDLAAISFVYFPVECVVLEEWYDDVRSGGIPSLALVW